MKVQAGGAVETIDMADIQQAWDRMKEEDVRFRYVIDMSILSSRTAELAGAPTLESVLNPPARQGLA